MIAIENIIRLNKIHEAVEDQPFKDFTNVRCEAYWSVGSDKCWVFPFLWDRSDVSSSPALGDNPGFP